MKTWLLTGLLLLKMTLFAIFGVFHVMSDHRNKVETDQEQQIAIAQHTVSQFSKMVDAENEHQAAIKKVKAIITKFNKGLSDSTRHRFAHEIVDMTIKYPNLDIDLICATITHESAHSWDSTIVSHAGAIGLMQIMPATGRMLAEMEGVPWTTSQKILTNPTYNIRFGTRYLSMLLSKYTELGYNREVAVQAALAAYNGGERRVALWLQKERNYKYLYPETRKYVPYVLSWEQKFANM